MRLPWGDSACFPVFQSYGIMYGGAEEREALPDVVKASVVRCNCIQEITHRRIVSAVADQDQVKQAGCVVDEIGYGTPAEIELTEILISLVSQQFFE